jgi:uncharacterized membrane protein YfcA
MFSSVTWIIYPLIFIAGFVDSIAGGGGLISLTSYAAIGLPAHMALGTNKFSSVFGTFVSMCRFAKNGHIQWHAAAFSVAGALGGSALGARLALSFDERALKVLLVAAVPVVALFLLFKKDFGKQERSVPKRRVAIIAFTVSMAIGAYDGFFGPGAGTFMIMAYTSVLGLGLLKACGNAKLVNFSSNLAAVVTFLIGGNVRFAIGIPCALCGILGGYVGAGLAMKKGVRIVKPFMLFIIAVLLVKIVVDLSAASAII